MDNVLLEKHGMVVKARNWIAKERWEDFTRRTPISGILQTVEFASAISKTIKLTPKFLTVEDAAEEIQAGLLIQIEGLKNIVFRKFPFKIFALDTPMFLESPKGVAALDLLLHGLDKLARQIGVAEIKIIPCYHGSYSLHSKELRRLLNKRGYMHETVCTIIMDLSKSIDDIWRNLHKKRRRNIRRAKERGLEFREAENSSEMKDYYRLERQTNHRLGLQPEPYSFFQAIWKHLVNTGKAKVFFVYHKHDPIAGEIGLTYDNKCELYSWRGASDSRFWRLHPNDFIAWSLIEWGHNSGYKTYDLVHYYTDSPKGQFYNLYMFKKHFGTKVYLNKYSKCTSQAKLATWNALHTIYKSMTKVQKVLNREG